MWSTWLQHETQITVRRQQRKAPALNTCLDVKILSSTPTLVAYEIRPYNMIFKYMNGSIVLVEGWKVFLLTCGSG